MTAPAAVEDVLARDLGARGSRTALAGTSANPTELTPGANALLAAVPAWWSSRAAATGLSGAWLDVRHALAAQPPTGLANPPAPVVTGDQDLGSAYVAALSAEVRARHGRHYTPTPLAEQLWMMTRAALGHSSVPRRLVGLVRDPACGAGALLLPALREHIAASVHTDPELTLVGLPNLIQGIDADPAAVWLANVVLAAEALPVLASVPASRRRPLPALARTGDGLARRNQPARVLLMNPPYGRVRLSTDERERFAHVLYGHANLYGLFMGAALEDLDERGVLAALVPTSFTAGKYFASLRAELSRSAPLRSATFVADRAGVFTGVLQETCLAVFTRRKAQRTEIATMNSHLSAVAKVKSPRGGGPWLLPRRADDAHIAAAAAAMPATLAGHGWRVSTGPLVWNRRRDDLGPHAAPGRLPVLWAADLDGGRLRRDGARDQLRYLRLRGPEERAVLALSTPAVLVQRTTAPEQSRRLVCLELTDDDLHSWGGSLVVENHVNVLRPTVAGSALTRGLLARLLGTDVIDRVARSLSGSVALSAYELESLPLPGEEVLARWQDLDGVALDRAVVEAYRPTT